MGDQRDPRFMPILIPVEVRAAVLAEIRSQGGTVCDPDVAVARFVEALLCSWAVGRAEGRIEQGEEVRPCMC
uniref:Uncharacterized protein n=1 Tax=viral metagenome TaxID=1070528 RepID=A0A6M3M5R0_9ZZZZ